MSDGPPAISRILAGQSHYPNHLFRTEGRGRSGSWLVGEHLFDRLREENTIATTFAAAVRFLPRFLLGC